MEVMDMTDKDQITVTIDRLMDVRRAKQSSDPKEELERQEKVLKVKLESLGVSTTELPEK